MTLKPLADKVVVKRLEAEEKTKSGIYLAAAAQEKPEVFEVVAVGPGGMVDGNEVKMEVKAGVGTLIQFSDADATKRKLPAERGVIVSNPPYGERMLEKKEAQELYRDMGGTIGQLPDWKSYVISSEPDFERFYGQKATKRRKLYNGMMLCYLNMYC